MNIIQAVTHLVTLAGGVHFLDEFVHNAELSHLVLVVGFVG